MKIITLVDNSSISKKLATEHGLSLYIETEKHKILFDTGKTDLFIQNAEKLNIDLKEVDFVVISHGHSDHIGGLVYFLKINQKAHVYLKKEVFTNHYYSIRNETQKYIGYASELFDYNDRFVFIESACNVFDDLILITNFDKKYAEPKANKMLFKEHDFKLIPDDFHHELIFVIQTKNGLTIFSGCAHNGILNIVATVKRFFPNLQINTVIGGFHLIDNNEFVETESENEIKFIGEELKRLTPETIYYTGHCTGENAYKILSSVLNKQIQKLNTFVKLNLLKDEKNN